MTTPHGTSPRTTPHASEQTDALTTILRSVDYADERVDAIRQPTSPLMMMPGLRIVEVHEPRSILMLPGAFEALEASRTERPAPPTRISCPQELIATVTDLIHAAHPEPCPLLPPSLGLLDFALAVGELLGLGCTIDRAAVDYVTAAIHGGYLLAA